MLCIYTRIHTQNKDHWLYLQMMWPQKTSIGCMKKLGVDARHRT